MKKDNSSTYPTYKLLNPAKWQLNQKDVEWENWKGKMKKTTLEIKWILVLT